MNVLIGYLLYALTILGFGIAKTIATKLRVRVFTTAFPEWSTVNSFSWVSELFWASQMP